MYFGDVETGEGMCPPRREHADWVWRITSFVRSDGRVRSVADVEREDRHSQGWGLHSGCMAVQSLLCRMESSAGASVRTALPRSTRRRRPVGTRLVGDLFPRKLVETRLCSLLVLVCAAKVCP